MAKGKEDAITCAVRVLNEALNADRRAVEGIFGIAFPCNQELAKHPTVQVDGEDHIYGTPSITVLGLINGLFGVDDDDWGYIAKIVNPHSSEPSRIVRFVDLRVYDENERRLEDAY